MAQSDDQRENPVDLIIKETGMTLTQIGSVVGVSWQAAQQWRKRGRIPARHIKPISIKTKIPKKKLDPDLY